MYQEMRTLEFNRYKRLKEQWEANIENFAEECASIRKEKENLARTKGITAKMKMS